MNPDGQAQQSPHSPLGSQTKWVVQRLGGRITFRHTRQPRTDLIPSRQAFPRDLDCRAPVISHVTEHPSSSRDSALALAEKDLQTLARNTITQPPARVAQCGLRERGEGGVGAVNAEKTFRFPDLISCTLTETFGSKNTANSLSALWFIVPTLNP